MSNPSRFASSFSRYFNYIAIAAFICWMIISIGILCLTGMSVGWALCSTCVGAVVLVIGIYRSL